jgi:hypothetical protein
VLLSRVLQQLPAESFPRLRVARADSDYAKYGLPAWVQGCTRFVLQLVRPPAQAVGWLLLP